MRVNNIAISAIVLLTLGSSSFDGLRKYDHVRGEARQALDEADVEIDPDYTAYHGFAISAVEDTMTLDLEVNLGVMDITITGPADSWFGWGLDSSTMQDTYAIIVSENGVTEHILSKQSSDQSDTELELNNVQVISDTTEGNLRTVQLMRTAVQDENHENDVVDGEGVFNVISARSDPANPSMSVSKHPKTGRGASVLNLVAVESGGYATGKDGGGPPEDEESEMAVDMMAGVVEGLNLVSVQTLLVAAIVVAVVVLAARSVLAQPRKEEQTESTEGGAYGSV